MNRIGRFAAFSAISVTLLAGPAFARAQDDHRDNHDQGYHNDAEHPDNRDQGYHNDASHRDAYVRHDEWRRGYHMQHEDWDRAQRVDDWRDHHLRQPPRGYEWRLIDGNYVLANIRTGTIDTVIAVH